MSTDGKQSKVEESTVSVSLVVPTSGRRSLENTLKSIWSQSVQPLEVVLVGDGVRVQHDRCRCISLPPPARSDWGHSPRNEVMPLLRGTHVMALDDDDALAPGAIEAVVRACKRYPQDGHLFRMHGAPCKGTKWVTKEIVHGNVGTPMFVHPAKVYAQYLPFHGGDCAFIKHTASMLPAVRWHEEIIVHVRPSVEAPPVRRTMQWMYGVTTVPSRIGDMLPKTLDSLARAGFEYPRLFVDGADSPEEWSKFGLETTVRSPRIYTYGNWVLGLAELFIRNPSADRYAMFQDDMLACKNLKQYLEQVDMRERCYWNLLTFPVNQSLSGGKNGFFLTNQRGKGAVGLVFSREAVKILLSHQHMIDRVENRKKDARTGWEKGWESVDGGVVTALVKAGYSEMCHNPSLVTHIGHKSSMSHPLYPPPPSWRGEEFDALSLLS